MIDNKDQISHLKYRSRGFSLLEMVVAIGVFTIVITIAFGAFHSLLDTHRQMKALDSAMNNLNTSLESMTRDIRFGTHYFCEYEGSGSNWHDEDDANVEKDQYECSSLAFTFSGGENGEERTRYSLDSGRIKKEVHNEGSEIVTASEVDITNLNFWVDRKEEEGPALVILEVEGKVAVPGKDPAAFSLQTASSQRNPDN